MSPGPKSIDPTIPPQPRLTAPLIASTDPAVCPPLPHELQSLASPWDVPGPLPPLTLSSLLRRPVPSPTRGSRRRRRVAPPPGHSWLGHYVPQPLAQTHTGGSRLVCPHVSLPALVPQPIAALVLVQRPHSCPLPPRCVLACWPCGFTGCSWGTARGPSTAHSTGTWPPSPSARSCTMDTHTGQQPLPRHASTPSQDRAGLGPPTPLVPPGLMLHAVWCACYLGRCNWGCWPCLPMPCRSSSSGPRMPCCQTTAAPLVSPGTRRPLAPPPLDTGCVIGPSPRRLSHVTGRTLPL